jgi:hypothetical protein
MCGFPQERKVGLEREREREGERERGRAREPEPERGVSHLPVVVLVAAVLLLAPPPPPPPVDAEVATLLLELGPFEEEAAELDEGEVAAALLLD